MTKERIIFSATEIALAMGAYLYSKEQRMPRDLELLLGNIVKIVENENGETNLQVGGTKLSFSFSFLKSRYVLTLKSGNLKFIDYWVEYCKEIEREGKIGVEISGYRRVEKDEIEILF